MTEQPAPAVQSGPHPSVLVIDPQVGLARTLARSVADRYRVVAARTGRQGLEYLKSAQPEAIVLDLQLPDTDGLLLMVKLQSVTRAPVLVCTSRNDPVDVALTRQLGAIDFISKPVSVHDLEMRLARATCT